MTSIREDLPTKYRSRAAQSREKAAIEPDEFVRKALLHDAELWERMAAYEEAKGSSTKPRKCFSSRRR